MADEIPVTPTAIPAAAPLANTGGATGSWDEPTPTERFIHSAATAAVAATKGAAGMAKEVLLPEGDTEVAKIKDIAKKLIIDPAAKMEMKAQTAKTPAESIGYSIAEGIPLIGPYAAEVAEQTGQQAGSGDVAGAAGTVVGNLLAAKAGEEVSETAKAGAKTLGVSEQLSKLGTHLNATAKTFAESAGEGARSALEAKAPEGSLEAGFVKLGGKKVRGATPKPAVEPAPLPPQPKLPEDGTYPAIQTDDGGLYFDRDFAGKTHVQFAKEQGIPPERIVSGGWLKDGDYEPSERSDIVRWSEQEKAKQRVAAKRQEPEPDKFAEAGGKLVGKAPEPAAPAAPYHPDLQKVIDLPGVQVHTDPSQVTEAKHFVTPDGKFVRLPEGLDHDGAILKTFSADAENVPADVRPKFMSETGAMRLNPTTDRNGTTLHVSVPVNGVTPDQVDALKQAVGQGLKGQGHLMLETADNPRDIKTEYKDFARPFDVEPMLREIGAHPDQEPVTAAASSIYTTTKTKSRMTINQPPRKN